MRDQNEGKQLNWRHAVLSHEGLTAGNGTNSCGGISLGQSFSLHE
jgi:hypothetical protein